MSYYEEKHKRDLALVRLLHGSVAGDEQLSEEFTGFDGGPRGERPASPLPWGVDRGVHVEPRDEVAWGPTYEIEDGAALIFPELFGEVE